MKYNPEKKIENLRKMFLVLTKDTEAVVAKLTARIDEIKDKESGQETLDIYAPVASRLGMGELKARLEDLAFPLVYPREYKKTKEMLKNKYEQKEKDLIKIKHQLIEELKNNGLENFEISSRLKHLYSLFKKLLKPQINNNINLIHDLIAIRVIVKTIEDCYRVLGIIHKMWKPVPGKISDYIAVPKPNGYQSLHTAVFTDKNKIVEIQIRTREMHERAEHGVAAHWVYDEMGKPTKAPKSDKYLLWANNLQNKVFCFTPAGDVIDLPQGATALDFAYAVHTEIGSHAIGALVNNKFVSLETVLKSGDLVEIKTQKNKWPSQGWLKQVKTPLAKKQIRAFFKKEGR